MGATAINGWEWPEFADPANGPGGFQSVLQDVEATVSDAALQTYIPEWTSTGSIQPGSPTKLEGKYRVDHGICHLNIWLAFGASSGGGSGSLYLTLPFPTNAAQPEQIMSAKLYVAAGGGGIYRGHVEVPPGVLQMPIYFPISANDCRMSQWRNVDATLAYGTSVPLVPGGHALSPNSNLTIQGSYFV